MASVQTIAGKTCNKCGSLVLAALNESTGTVQSEVSCLNCMGKRNCDKPGIQVEDPGEKFFNPAAKAEEPKQKSVGKVDREVSIMTLGAPESLEDIYGQALNALKSLPMPSDVKQFKKIQKVIKLIEELKNGD